MAQLENPAKEFQFGLILPGLAPQLVQKVTTPDIDFEKAEHGDAGFKVKTAGLINIGTLKLSKLKPSDALDTYIYNWAKLIRNTKTGGGAPPSIYKRKGLIEQYGDDGITVIHTWVISGVWPEKINGVSYDKLSSNNTVEEIEFSVDEVD